MAKPSRLITRAQEETDMSELAALINTSCSAVGDVVVPKLSQATLTFLMDPNPGVLEADMAAVTEKYGLSKSVVQGLSKHLIVIWQNAIREGWDETRLKAMTESSGLSSAVSVALGKHWKKCSKLVASSGPGRSIEGNEVVDMDWSFGVTAASNDSGNIGKTFLQMRLTLLDKTTENVRNVFLELSLEQFYHFLAQLEGCKTAIDILSGHD